MSVIILIVGMLLIGVVALRLIVIPVLSRTPAAGGVHDGLLATCPVSQNCVSSSDTRASHQVTRLSLSGDTATAMQRLIEILSQLPGTQIVSHQERYLHATVRTRLMGYIDDVELLLEPSSRTIQIRSSSRLGKRDFGANRQRVEQLRRDLAGRV